MNLATAEPSAPSDHAMRVFLVEDFPAVRNLIIENLAEIAGVEVAGFAESEEYALSWLSKHPCDVLILDLELRQGNGLGVLKALAPLDPARKMVKIVYSNHASPSIRKLASQLGAGYFFDKTMDTPKLRLLLENLSISAA